MSDIQRYGEEFQRVSKNGFDTSVRSLSEMGKGFEAIRTTMMDYTKKSFEDGTAPSSSWRAQSRLSRLGKFNSVRQEGLRSLRGPGIEDRRDVRRAGS